MALCSLRRTSTYTALIHRHHLRKVAEFVKRFTDKTFARRKLAEFSLFQLTMHPIEVQ
jgi:hypothetical protein